MSTPPPTMVSRSSPECSNLRAVCQHCAAQTWSTVFTMRPRSRSSRYSPGPSSWPRSRSAQDARQTRKGRGHRLWSDALSGRSCMRPLLHLGLGSAAARGHVCKPFLLPEKLNSSLEFPNGYRLTADTRKPILSLLFVGFLCKELAGHDV